MRGEHRISESVTNQSRGSSPRARGAHADLQPAAGEPGIIPACAGSTPQPSRRGRPEPDHPRVRGEHQTHEPDPETTPGSSPRARGAPGRGSPDARQPGIIPACAGSTSPAAANPPTMGDHPRVRGEHEGPYGPQYGAPGIIPACAGSTIPRAGPDRTARDHPRVRGEHGGRQVWSLRVLGSSPRARGAPPRRRSGSSWCGIIPACAESTCRSRGRSGRRRDHPRVRGEHFCSHSHAALTWGSSPRARGALAVGDEDVASVGIIPACAGSTHVQQGRRHPRGDHPRVRGEHCALALMPLMRPGSSPRARGAPQSPAHRRLQLGIIPACAGSTQPGANVFDGHGDHPRVRGEHGANRVCRRRRPGSSPRARGALEDLTRDEATLGIIPACAGSTGCRGGRAWRSRDHPRVRGEHGEGARFEVVDGGSSPRARGAHERGWIALVDEGIIPACAGSTAHRLLDEAGPRDHPRVRGEHAPGFGLHRRALGSSPRARGAPQVVAVGDVAAGIIPACAGSTPTVRRRCRRRWDHPRVRGEHSPTTRPAPSSPGSSPRARGAHHGRPQDRRPGGIIPACAGSTGTAWTS